MRFVLGIPLVLLALWWLRAGWPSAASWRANGPRGLLTIASTFLFFTALRRLPFAEALALSYLGPLLVATLAALILKERLRADVLGGVLLVSGMASQMGWRATFAITGLLGVVTAAIYMLVVREPVRLSPIVRQDYRQVLRRLGGHSSFRLTTLSMIGILFFTNATGAWTPAFLARAHGLSIAQAGLFVGLTSGLIGMICVLLTGPLIDRLARRDIRWMGWLPAIALTIMIASMAIGVQIEDTRIALPILAIAPCLALVPPTCIFAVLQTAIPAGLRASATAMLFLAANLLGMGIGPTLVGALSSYWETSSALSLRPALFFGILPSIVGVVACLLLARTIAGDVRRLADEAPASA